MLAFSPEAGTIQLGDRRVLLMNAASMGALRKALIDTVGMEHAKGIFMRAGYASGIEDALKIKEKTRFDSDLEWLMAGPRMHQQVGHVQVEPREFRLDRKSGDFFVSALWRNSYEAAEHRRRLGPSSEPACWTLAGYASGWSTAVLGEKALCVEELCEAKGDPHCSLEIRRVADWGERARGRDLDLEDLAGSRKVSMLEEAAAALEVSRASERQSREQFQAILDFAADMIWVRELDGDGRVLDANRAALHRLGLKRKEFVGRPVFDFWFSDRDGGNFADFTRRIIKDGSAFVHATFRKSSGEPLELELRGSLMRQDNRRVALVVARDIGESLQEHRRALTLYQAFTQSNDVMFFCDRNGVILDVNAAFSRVYGYSREEAVGQTPRIVRSNHSTHEMYKSMWAAIKGKGHWRGQLINKAKDGREIPVTLTITGVRDVSGAIVGYVSNAADISDHLNLRGRLAHSEALASLGEMAAVVAHEIRNPLGSIVMAARQLSAGGLASEDRELVVKVLRDESQRLNETLSTFLTYARPRQLKLGLASLTQVARDVCRMVESNPELLRGLRFETALDEALEPFPVDPDQLRQVMWNIVLNAIQALDGKGTVKVETGRLDSKVYFRVRDSGPGVPADMLKTLFKPFRTSKRQGTGLGLAVAERIIKSHGGSIDVTSSPKGAVFTVLLPAPQT